VMAKTAETPGVAGHRGETSHVRDPSLEAPATAVTVLVYSAFPLRVKRVLGIRLLLLTY
jgi:hypothetical protein